jgi:LPXTG-motif cell wall-anchored protein
VTITGQGLGDTTAVTFDGIEGTGLTDPTASPTTGALSPLAIVSDNVITVYSPPHPVGTVDLVVIDPDGASEPVDFTYVGAASPIAGGTGVDSVTPPTGPAVGGTTVTITGSCFTAAQAVFFGDAPASEFTVVSDTEIRAVSPAGTGTVDVTVIGSAECGTAALADGFAYQSALAVTGAGGNGLVMLAALLLLAGGAGVWVSRRREVLG